MSLRILSRALLEDGSVAMPSVAKGIPLLDQAAVDAIRRSQFRCGDCGAVPVPHLVTVDFNVDTTHWVPDVVETTPWAGRILVVSGSVYINPSTAAISVSGS